MEDRRNNLYTENNVNPKLNGKEKWSRGVDKQENCCDNESDHQCLHTLKKMYLGGIEIFLNSSGPFPPSQVHQRNTLKIEK